MSELEKGGNFGLLKIKNNQEQDTILDARQIQYLFLSGSELGFGEGMSSGYCSLDEVDKAVNMSSPSEEDAININSSNANTNTNMTPEEEDHNPQQLNQTRPPLLSGTVGGTNGSSFMPSSSLSTSSSASSSIGGQAGSGTAPPLGQWW